MNLKMVRSYSILISCPSDMNKYAEIVRKTIEKFNTINGIEQNVLFIPKDWRNDTIPSYGKTAQEIINEQIVDNSDVVIALFGSKFGTPTEKSGSGTLEEIERAYSFGCEVLTYFYEGSGFNLNEIDVNQLSKVQTFKTDYNGLYTIFKNDQELESNLLSKLNLLAKKMNEKKQNNISIYSYSGEEIVSNLWYVKYNIVNSKNIRKLKEEIDKEINEINSIHIEKKEVDLLGDNKNELRFLSMYDSLNYRTEISIGNDLKRIIYKYSELKSVFLEEDFFDIGDAYYRGLSIQGYRISGNKNEIIKTELLLGLPSKIKRFLSLERFFTIIDSLYFVPLIIKNESDCFAEDITVKIKFNKKYYFDIDQLILKDENTAEELMDILDSFEIKDNVDIENMEYGNVIYPIKPMQVVGLYGASNNYSLDYCNEYFQAKKKELYPYISNIKGDEVIFKFHFLQGLKQFTSQFLCAMLMFTEVPHEIEYEIISKTMNCVIKNKLLRKDDKNC